MRRRRMKWEAIIKGFHLYLARFLWSPCGMSANIVCAVWVGEGEDEDGDEDEDNLIDVMDDPAQVCLEVVGG